jgi:hypothetical protein
MINIPANFWHEIEKPLKYVLYGDTDSLYIYVPKDFKSVEESIKGCEEVAEQINDIIQLYYNSFLLPKMGVDPKFNETFFKTELTADSIMFLETKKNYAYKPTSIKGKVLDKTKVKYIGIPVVKSDTVPFTKDLLRRLVEEIALKKGVDKIAELQKAYLEARSTLEKHITEFDFEYIAAPGKWSDKDYDSEPAQIIGMRLYNTLLDKDVFRPGAFSLYIPIKFKSITHFNTLIDPIKFKSKNYLNDIASSKINYLGIPYGYNKEELRLVCNKYGIQVIPDELWQWDRLANNTVVKRITEVIKDSVNQRI